jgi:hypothetical protein
VFLDAHRSRRHVKVTDQRTVQDFAVCMRDLADVHYPDADQIRVVMDNLSTRTAGALYEAFPAPEARRILQRLEFHYTPKHASWLNMVQIEIGVLRGQCLGRRIGDRAVLNMEIAAWQDQRNASGARINGSSRRRRRAKSWPAPIQIPPKSRNHCDEVPAAYLNCCVRGTIPNRRHALPSLQGGRRSRPLLKGGTCTYRAARWSSCG